MVKLTLTFLIAAVALSASPVIVCLPIQEEPVCPNDATSFTLGFTPDPQPPFTRLVPNAVASNGDLITKVTVEGYPLYIVGADEYSIGMALPGLSSFDYVIDDTTIQQELCPPSGMPPDNPPPPPPPPVSTVPEPAFAGLVGLALVGLGIFKR